MRVVQEGLGAAGIRPFKIFSRMSSLGWGMIWGLVDLASERDFGIGRPSLYFSVLHVGSGGQEKCLCCVTWVCAGPGLGS